MQMLFVEMAVVAALIFIARQTARTLFGEREGCSSGCGKCATEEKKEGRIELTQIPR